MHAHERSCTVLEPAHSGSCTLAKATSVDSHICIRSPLANVNTPAYVDDDDDKGADDDDKGADDDDKGADDDDDKDDEDTEPPLPWLVRLGTAMCRAAERCRIPRPRSSLAISSCWCLC